MKIQWCVFPVLACLLTGAAAAQTQTPASPSTEAAVDQASGQAEAPNAISCANPTGSRLVSSAVCGTAHGMSYDQKNIDSTGSVTLGGALSSLSPSVSVGRH